MLECYILNCFIKTLSGFLKQQSKDQKAHVGIILTLALHFMYFFMEKTLYFRFTHEKLTF